MKDVNYDFTYEVAKQVQEDINFLLNSKDKEIFKRYLTYRKYASVLDPDNSSKLLQDIYIEKWDKTYLQNCLRTENNKLVYSDTMTSVQTLLNHFYQKVGSSKKGLDWNKYLKEHPTTKRCSEIALRNIYQEVMNGSKDYPVFCKYFLDDNSLVCKFIKCYHSIGNYLPVPKYFNVNRSNKGLHDRFDLTLIKIKEYYESTSNQEKVLRELLHIKRNKNNEIIATQKWLDGFGSWKTFIIKNYLQDYVDMNDKDYPIKKEVKANWDKPLAKFDYLDYFSKITQLISKRGERILSSK